MSRHAYLIMAHNHFDFLKELLACLDDSRNDIYLHIDKKAGPFDKSGFSDIVKKSRLYFTERLDVHWGGYSQIACELLLLKSAVSRHPQGVYTYYHLLSGADLPLKSQNEIHTFFERHAGKEFLAFDPQVSQKTRERVSLWHFFRESRLFLAEPADHILTLLQRLLGIDSPSGYTMHAMQFLQEEAEKLGFSCVRSAKGNLMVTIPGKDHAQACALSAHCDTLGLMVRSIKDNGMLAVTNIGGPTLPTLDSAYCRIHTREGKTYTGTILCTAAAKHVHEEASTLARTLDTLEVRIDEVVKTKEDVQRLGIANGDIIAIDPKTCVTDSGFIKSRFLDDKISVACLFAVLRHLHAHPLPLKKDVIVIFSSYEEVGHGASFIPELVEEMISVDMGCIGLDLACTEYDVSAALRGGNNIRGALIGPGVHASHGMERTHIEALDATVSLILAYLRTLCA